MADPAAITTAILVGQAAAPTLRALEALLAAAGVAVTIVDTPEQAAAALVTAPDTVSPCVAIDVGPSSEVCGRIVTSGARSTSTSIHVDPGSSIDTPSRIQRSLMRPRMTRVTSASSLRLLTPMDA